MRTIFFLSVFLLSGLAAMACTFAPRTFCYTASYFEQTTVLRGVYVRDVYRGIRIDVLDVYRGSENRDTITVWDGTDFDCNGTFPMNASLLGSPGDTLVLILPEIDSLENAWEVLGDYRSSLLWLYTPILTQQGDSLTGAYSQPFDPENRIALNDFVDNQGQCYSEATPIAPEKEELAIRVFPNPASSFLYVEQNENRSIHLSLYDLKGRLLLQSEANGETFQLDISTLAKGLYAIEIRSARGKKVEKLLIQ